MADILNEIVDGLKELIRETDEKYDKFLFEDSTDKILKKSILQKLNEDAKYNFTEEDLNNVWQHYKSYLIDILNGEYDLNTAREDLQSLIGSEFDPRTKNVSNEQPLNEKVYKVYHGTNQQFNKFDFKRATQGIVWFTDSPESIQKGEHGGAGNKIIMTRYITINKPAGWAEYEKYGLQQLEDMGYDGVILPQGDKTDYFVFSNKSISAKGPKELNEVGEANLQPYPYTKEKHTHEYLYRFATEDGDKYVVNIMQMTSSWIIDYRLESEDSKFTDVVNKGRLYRVMATLAKIMREFVKLENPDRIKFDPVKNTDDDDRRLKLYGAFLKKNLPSNYTMQYEEYNGYIITKKQI
jgi:hypothetical protein